MPVSDAEQIAVRVAAIRETIAAAARRVRRDPTTVRLLAATKTVPVQRLESALACGVTLFGENRVQEALPKLDALGSARIEWHFIGRLQRRKVKLVVGRFALIHSVESLELAEEIHKRGEQTGIRQPVLLEINVGDEASKGGFSPDAAIQALPVLARLSNLEVRGLMTIPPPNEDPERTRPFFRRLRELAADCHQRWIGTMAFEELSMGMSHDFAVAVEEGATIVRIGTEIFGARPPVEA